MANGKPTDITSATLRGWYRTIDPDGIVAAGADVYSGSAVTNWTDRSGAGNTLVKEGSPTYAANGLATGRPTISGGGSNGFRTATGLALPSTGVPIWAIALGRITANNDYYRILGLNTPSNGDVFSQGVVPLINSPSFAGQNRFSYFYAFSETLTDISLNTFGLFEGIPTSSTSAVSRLNGGAASGSITLDMVGKSMDRLGFMTTSHAASEGASFEAAEMVWGTGVLSTADREWLEGCLLWNNGLQALLPGGHTHASARPTIGGGSTTIVAAAAAQGYAGQAVAVNRRRSAVVTAASEAFTGQGVIVGRGRFVAVAAASLTDAGQAITVNARRAVAVAAATLANAAQAIKVNARKAVTVAPAPLTHTAQPFLLGRTILAASAGFGFAGRAIAVSVGGVAEIVAFLHRRRGRRWRFR